MIIDHHRPLRRHRFCRSIGNIVSNDEQIFIDKFKFEAKVNVD